MAGVAAGVAAGEVVEERGVKKAATAEAVDLVAVGRGGEEEEEDRAAVRRVAVACQDCSESDLVWYIW